MKNILTKIYNNDTNLYEIGVDEVGRGPMFGRLYTAAVILPKNDTFKYELLKDSKKFTSEKKINEVAEYIKTNALAWSITFSSEKEIDDINILKSTHNSMHKSIKNVIDKIDNTDSLYKKYYLLIDGNNFKPFTYFNNENQLFEEITNVLIEGGDNKYCSIAAASIIAKVERDKYIKDICLKFPKLNLFYNLNKNKGYGTKQHLDGIKEFGISPWHRKTFGICKNSKINDEEFFI